MRKIFDFLLKITISFLVFLVPIFFLPFTFEFFEFNKIYLIFYLTLLSFIFWLGKISIEERRISFLKNPLHLPIFIFLILISISTIFSIDKISSIFGFYGRFSDSYLLFLSLIIFFFLILNSGLNEEFLLKIFLFSSILALIFAIFSISSVWQNIPKLKGIPYFRLRNFNPISGSLEGFSAFLAVLISILIGTILGNSSKKFKIFSSIFLIFSILLFFAIDFKFVNLVLIFSLISFLFFSISKRAFKENPNLFLVPISILFLSILFLFFSPNLNLPREQILPQKISYQTAFNSLISSPKNFFLGSGPGTFYFQFLKIKPDSIFRTNLWQIRFDRPSNNISEILIDFGILGFLSFLSIFFIYFLISAFVFKKENSIFFLPILTLFFCQFFYYQNAILAFLLFFLLPLSLLNFKRGLSEFEYSLKEFPELNLVFSSIFLVFLIFFFFSGYLGFKIYLADFNFVKGIFGSGKERIERMEKGVSLNKNFSYYKIILAREYLTQVLQEAQKAPDVVDSQKITDFSVKAINTAREATKVSKENVFAWETLAIIYRELQPFAQGATDWTIDSFEMASSLDPKNPDLYLEIFKLDLVKNDLKKAREYLEKAKKLNENYIETRIQEAILLEREGNGEEAKNKLEKILEDFPFHVEANFNLGRIYFGEGEVDKAIPYFERAILVFPNHSNSLYSLGLCYEKKGDKEKALEYFNKVLELNPNNPVILQKIEELKK